MGNRFRIINPRIAATREIDIGGTSREDSCLMVPRRLAFFFHLGNHQSRLFHPSWRSLRHQSSEIRSIDMPLTGGWLAATDLTPLNVRYRRSDEH